MLGNLCIALMDKSSSVISDEINYVRKTKSNVITDLYSLNKLNSIHLSWIIILINNNN